jgi:RNA polymerase sigma-70 factor (ECF subfamily)
MQETFTYFYRKFPGFRLTAALRSFLYPVVRNIALATIRKRRRAADQDPDTLPAPDSQTHELHDVLSGLSDDHREVILMRFVDGFSMEEIAAALSIPPGTVRSRLHHAIKQLRADPRLRRYFDAE